MGQEESEGSGDRVMGGLVRTRSGRLIPAAQALANAAPKKAASNAHTKWTLLGVLAGLGLLFVGLAMLISAGNGRAAPSSSSIASILEDVGHVISSTKGIGINR